MKKVKIVSADWLEESLVHNKGRPKREVPYLFTLSKAAKRVALEREKVRAQERSSGDGKPPPNPGPLIIYIARN